MKLSWGFLVCFLFKTLWLKLHLKSIQSMAIWFQVPSEKSRWNKPMERADETGRWNELMFHHADETSRRNEPMKQADGTNWWNKPILLRSNLVGCFAKRNGLKRFKTFFLSPFKTFQRKVSNRELWKEKSDSKLEVGNSKSRKLQSEFCR